MEILVLLGLIGAICAIGRLFSEPEKIYGRFPDGRRYYITPRGGMGLDLDDPQTIEAIQKKFKDIDDAMRISQPHMYDKDGKFVGGALRMGGKQ